MKLRIYLDEKSFLQLYELNFVKWSNVKYYKNFEIEDFRICAFLKSEWITNIFKLCVLLLAFSLITFWTSFMGIICWYFNCSLLYHSGPISSTFVIPWFPSSRIKLQKKIGISPSYPIFRSHLSILNYFLPLEHLNIGWKS